MKHRIRTDILGDVLRIVILTAFFAAAGVLLEKGGIRGYLFDLPAMKTLLGSGGQAGNLSISILIFVIAGGALITMGVPRLLASAAGGIIYGALLGTLLSLAASILGSSLLYLGGRFTLGSIMERRLSGRLDEWRVRFRENAFWWVLYGRLFPFSNSTVMSLLCGSCAVPFLPYSLGSLIGFAPLATVFACYGSGGMNGDFLQIGIATVLLALSVLSRRILDSLFHRQKAQAG
ncbi:MAG TPA: VTT domain-containing protein [Methanoregulaceae archaeon]|nr:VTT domain-containing protein [Methanoregulaceae archaeon]